MRYLIIASLSAVLFLCSAAIGAAAAPQTYGELTQTQRIAFLQSLMDRGDFDQAQMLLAGSRFDEGDLGYAAAFIQAQLWRRQGRAEEAEALMRKIIAERPDFGRVRLELASLLAEQGNRTGAGYHLRLLADSAEDPGSRQRLESVIDQINPQRPFTLNGFVSIAPSTNVNNGSSQETVRLGGLPFTIARQGRAQSGLGVRAGVIGAYTHQFDERHSAYAAGSAVVSEYSGATFDTITGDLRFGLRRQGLGNLLGAELILDRRYIALEPMDYGIGGRLFLRQPLAPKLLFSGELQFIDRSYDRDAASRSQTFSGEARLDYSYAAARSVYLKAGGTDESVDQRAHNSFTGGHLEVGTFQALPFGIQAKAGLRRYEADFPGMNQARSDQFIELRASFLKSDFSYRGFTPRLGLSYYRQKSNVALYDFDRLGADVTFTKEF